MPHQSSANASCTTLRHSSSLTSSQAGASPCQILTPLTCARMAIKIEFSSIFALAGESGHPMSRPISHVVGKRYAEPCRRV
eukprot:2472623-Prymnesium_polylepis.1